MTAKDWKYGDAGDRYPVKPGTLWEAGPHLLACGDLTNRDHYRALLTPAMFSFIRVPLVYVDPPWTQSLLTGFRTKAKAPASDQSLEDFTRTLLEPLSTLPRQPTILMEGSAQPKAMDAVLAAVDTITDLAVRQVWNITYFGDKPGLLYWITGHDDPVDPQSLGFHDMDDAHTPAHAIEAFTEEGNFVLDPCLGRGLTAMTCQALGRRCIGMELNPRRLAVALDTLHKKHGLEIKPSGPLTTS